MFCRREFIYFFLICLSESHRKKMGGRKGDKAQGEEREEEEEEGVFGFSQL